MATFMPTVPRIFFAYVEPIICLIGTLQPIFDHVTLPASIGGRPAHAPATVDELLQAYLHGGMVFGMGLAIIAIMFTEPVNRKLVRTLVLILAVVDIPHWMAFASVLGWDGLVSWRDWDGSLWTQLIAPLFTFGMKVAYLAGAFGPDRPPVEDRKSK